jgi:hypothetical protein
MQKIRRFEEKKNFFSAQNVSEKKIREKCREKKNFFRQKPFLICQESVSGHWKKKNFFWSERPETFWPPSTRPEMVTKANHRTNFLHVNPYYRPTQHIQKEKKIVGRVSEKSGKKC